MGLRTAGPNCCCTCNDWRACVESKTPIIEVTITGITNIGCASCGSLNDTYLFDAVFAGTPGTCYITDGVSGDCFSTLGYAAGYDIPFRGTAVIMEISFLAGGGNIQWGWSTTDDPVPEIEPVIAMQRLCRGETVTLPLFQNNLSQCSASSSTCTMKLY